MAPKISVIMPAFNEASHIASNLKEVVDTLNGFEYDFEVIVVDDGSPDNTYLHAARVLLDHPEQVRIVRYDQNRGKGNALMCGTWYARGRVVVFLDADMDLHPEQLPMFFEMLESNSADAVIGSKWHDLSKVKYPLVRRLYSKVYFGLVHLLFGLPLRDTQTGLKVFRIEMLQRIFPYVLVKRFAFDIEMLSVAHHWGYKMIDAPVTLDFQRDIGRLSVKHVWRVLLDTLAVFYRLRLISYYDRIVAETAHYPAREITVADLQSADIA